MPRILVAGDVVPSGLNEAAFRAGDAGILLGDLSSAFEEADLRLANLEAPLLARHSPTMKSGPVLSAPEACIEGLRAIGFDVIGLANNHAMDHGELGLRNTIDVCSGAGIACAGAGADLDAASRIVVRLVQGLRVGILALAEQEFGIAARATSGVCPLDPIVAYRSIESSRNEFDSLIVIIHGGNEFYRYPRPSLQRVCRFLVDLGADLVVCQHSHIVGCYEPYNNGHIVYGQGNFICAGQNRPSFWNEGILLTLDLSGERSSRLQVLPFLQSIDGLPGARRMVGQRLREFDASYRERSEEILDPSKVESRWKEFCESRRRLYLRRLGSPHRAFRLLDRYTGIIQYLLRRSRIRLDLLNLIRCESHREVIIDLLSRE